MMYMAIQTIFLTIGQTSYRTHFPGMLEGFDRTTLQDDNMGERFDSDVREYYIKDYKIDNRPFDIHVREVGSDLEPARIEAWFSTDGKNTDPPVTIIEKIWESNEEKSKGRTLMYINGKFLG